MTKIKGDFLGFTYNGVHSYDMGIVRVSNSNRYNDNLVPTQKDQTAAREGNDGTFFFGSEDTKRDITINFAFDRLTDTQIRKIRNLYKDKTLHELIFDENPYKVYMAKISQVATIKFLCLDNDDHNNLQYYGEGSLTFTCYFPYAVSRLNYLDEYNVNTIPEWLSDEDYEITHGITYAAAGAPARIQYDFDDLIAPGYLRGPLTSFTDWVYDLSLLVDIADVELGNSNIYIGTIQENTEYINLSEWKDESLIPQSESYDSSTHTYHLTNAGDYEMPFEVWYNASLSGTLTCSFQNGTNITTITNLKPLVGDKFITWNTRDEILVGRDDKGKRTGTIYNTYITSNAARRIPIGNSDLTFSGTQPMKLKFGYIYI